MTVLLCSIFVIPVQALEMEVPTVPESASRFMPSKPSNLGEGILELFRDAMLYLSPSLKESSAVAMGILAAVLTVSLIQTIPGSSQRSVNLAGTLVISLLLLGSMNSFIHMAEDSVTEISEYGKLLLPVMAAATAAQGGVNASSALYTGTVVFDSVLSSIITKMLCPMIYLFLALAAAKSAVGEDMLKKLADQMKSLMTWLLKTILYVYTGYITITGVISGTTDAAALKAAKLTISGAVPVVGGILSDASEAVLVSAATVKNAAGLYGMFAILAIWIGPFLRTGIHYLILKTTGAVCSIFGSKEMTALIDDFSAAMGFLLAMTGTVCLMMLISLVCFMKGVV